MKKELYEFVSKLSTEELVYLLYHKNAEKVFYSNKWNEPKTLSDFPHF